MLSVTDMPFLLLTGSVFLMPDLVIGGLSLPHFISTLCFSLFAWMIIRRIAGRLGLYEWVWHPGLFNLAVYFILVMGVAIFQQSTF